MMERHITRTITAYAGTNPNMEGSVEMLGLQLPTG